MELEQDNLIDDLTKPPVFLSKINTLKEKLPSILDDFKKYYIFYNKNPEYTEYQQMFENIKSQQLKKKLGIVEKKYNGSDELISDYKEMYNLDYLTNFSLFYGIVLLGVMLASKFKGPVVKV